MACKYLAEDVVGNGRFKVTSWKIRIKLNRVIIYSSNIWYVNIEHWTEEGLKWKGQIWGLIVKNKVTLSNLNNVVVIVDPLWHVNIRYWAKDGSSID